MSPVLEDPVYRQIVRAPADRKPILGQCKRCRWVFVVLYIPLAINDVATLMQRATCPMCAFKKIVVPV